MQSGQPACAPLRVLSDVEIDLLLLEWNCTIDSQKLKLFACNECGSLQRKHKGFYVETKWHGEERCFCAKCIHHCTECGEYYCRKTEYRHEGCKQQKEASPARV